MLVSVPRPICWDQDLLPYFPHEASPYRVTTQAAVIDPHYREIVDVASRSRLLPMGPLELYTIAKKHSSVGRMCFTQEK